MKVGSASNNMSLFLMLVNGVYTASRYILALALMEGVSLASACVPWSLVGVFSLVFYPDETQTLKPYLFSKVLFGTSFIDDSVQVCPTEHNFIFNSFVLVYLLVL